MNNKLPYPVVSKQNPILAVHVRGMDLKSIVSVGETALYVKRVGDLMEFVKYLPFEERGNQLTFSFDGTLFAREGGRFEGRLVYKGVPIRTLLFTHDKPKVHLTGQTNV